MPTITLAHVQKNYGGGAPSAVRDLDLEIGDGEFMCLLGPSGCGKTTTLRMIAGLEHPTSGAISVGSRVMDDVDGGVFTPAEHRGMGLVFQSYALWPHLTIEKNVDFGLRLRKVDKASRKQRTDAVLRALSIDRYRDRYPAQLSGGQQQRVALARMLAVNPEVLLLDEPLSNLDSRLRLEMRAELKRLHAEYSTTIVFVTHDQWEAMTLATTIAVMSEGELQQVGTPDDIYGRPANRFVAEFVGNPPINIIDLGNAQPGALATWLLDFLDRRGKVSDLGSVGIRPESLRIIERGGVAPDGAFRGRATVTGVLPTGGSWIIELAVAGEKVFTTTSIPPRTVPGDEVTFWADAADLHVFTSDGVRSAAADRALTTA